MWIILDTKARIIIHSPSIVSKAMCSRALYILPASLMEHGPTTRFVESKVNIKPILISILTHNSREKFIPLLQKQGLGSF